MTAPKANGNNARYALTEAINNSNRAAQLMQVASGELRNMQEQLGRPNYSRISTILLELSASVSNTSRHLGDLRAVRAAAGQGGSEELAERVASLEATVAELQAALGVKLS